MWPPLASYRMMDKEFTCSGSITAYGMCNVQYIPTINGPVSRTRLGLILRSKGARVHDRRILYGFRHFTVFQNEMVFKDGDQLEYIISDSSRVINNDESK